MRLKRVAFLIYSTRFRYLFKLSTNIILSSYILNIRKYSSFIRKKWELCVRSYVFYITMDQWWLLFSCSRFTMPFLSLEREAGSKTEMGLAASRKVTEGYHTRIPGRLCVEYHGEETSNVRSEQSWSKRQNASNRLSSSSGQGKFDESNLRTLSRILRCISSDEFLLKRNIIKKTIILNSKSFYNANSDCNEC